MSNSRGGSNPTPHLRSTLLITTIWRSHKSTNIKQGLLFCKYIIYPEWKRLWASSLWSILVPNFGLIFLKIWNFFHRIHFKSNTKKSCYLAKNPVDFRFISLSLFCIIVSMLLSSVMSFISTVAHPTFVHGHNFLSLFLMLFCLLIFSDVDSMHCVAFLLILVKSFQIKIRLC